MWGENDYFLSIKQITMIHNKKQVPAIGIAIVILGLANVIAMIEGYTNNEKWYWVLVITLPLLLLAITNVRRKKNTVFKNFGRI